MARKPTNTADFFPHRVNHGKTMFKLEAKYGNDGYAFLFKLCEMLGASENHILDLSDAGDWDFFVVKMRVDEETCNAILQDLIAWKKIDKELFEGKKIIWYDNFVQGLSQLYINRRRELPSKPDFYSRNNSTPPQPTQESTQSKVEYSKEDFISEVKTPPPNSEPEQKALFEEPEKPKELPVKPPKKPKKPKAKKEPEEKDTGWKMWLDTYMDFLRVQTGKEVVTMHGSDYSGLRELRKTLNAEEGSDESALSEFLYILNNWSKLKDYHRCRLKAVEINSQLVNIQLQIREATREVAYIAPVKPVIEQKQLSGKEVDDFLGWIEEKPQVFEPKFKL